jgi:hypothetical protein
MSKIILITGASSGLGKATAEKFASWWMGFNFNCKKKGTTSHCC